MNAYDIAHRLISDKYAKWSHAGAFALADYLIELDDDLGTDTELNVVAIRCNFSEYASLQDWAHNYFLNAWEEMGQDEEDYDDEAFDKAITDYIQDHGTLIEFTGGIIVSNF